MVARNRPWHRSPARPSSEFNNFRQVVRRYPPSALLPVLARFTLSSGEPPVPEGALATAPPWAIALIARESVLWGNEHRTADVTSDSLRVLVNAHNNIFEMKDRAGTVGARGVHALLRDILNS